MAIRPACNVVGDAMIQTGMSYRTIAEKIGTMSEKEVEEFCTGAKLASPEQHYAISKALALRPDESSDATTAEKQGICKGRMLVAGTQITNTCVRLYLFVTMTIGLFVLANIHRARETCTRFSRFCARALENIGVLHERVSDDVSPLPLPSPVLRTPLALLEVPTEDTRATSVVETVSEPLHHKGLNPPGTFTWLKLHKITPYTSDTSRFDFAFEDPTVVSNVPVSCTCVVSATDDKPLCEDPDAPGFCALPGDPRPYRVFRAYTPITERGTPGIISFLIKRKKNGKMSNYIHDMKVGEQLGIMGYLQLPPSKIPWHLNRYDTVTMLAAGTGITPIYQILQYSLPSATNTTKFLLLYSNTTENDIAMRSQLDAMQKAHPAHFEVVYSLTKPTEDWTGEKGRIDADMIEKYAPPPPPGVRTLVCVAGPPSFVDAMGGRRVGDKYNGWTAQGELVGTLKDIGYTADQVHKF